MPLSFGLSWALVPADRTAARHHSAVTFAELENFTEQKPSQARKFLGVADR
jgi:hypothetical protein